MCDYYPFSSAEIEASANQRKFNRVFGEVLRLRLNYQRIETWPNILPYDLDCITASILIYEMYLEEYDPIRYAEEVQTLPPLTP